MFPEALENADPNCKLHGKELKHQVSRHRFVSEPEASPPDLWKMRFTQSQDILPK